MKNIFFFLVLLLFSLKQFSQDSIEGKIIFIEDNKEVSVEGATVKWLDTNKGTISNENGVFKLEKIAGNELLEISFLGFKTDTISVNNNKNINHILKISDENNLEEVTVSKRRRSAQRTYLMPQNIVKISEEELL